MPAFYVYIIDCTDKKGKKSLYTGYTQSLYTRFDQHKSGTGAKYTKGKKLKLIYYEMFISRSEAMSREIAIKKMKLDKKKQLIKDFRGYDGIDE